MALRKWGYHFKFASERGGYPEKGGGGGSNPRGNYVTNNVWKTLDEYSLSRNTNLTSTVQVYDLFFWQDKLSVYVFIGLHCLLPEVAIRVEVFCKNRCS